MNKTVNKSNEKTIILILYFGIILIWLFFTLTSSLSFEYLCSITTILLAAQLALIIFYRKKVIDPSMIIFIVFVLFQFGLPILKGIDHKFYNYYLTEFSNDLLIRCIKISYTCILAYGLAMILFKGNDNVVIKESQNGLFKEQNKNVINAFAVSLLFVTGIVSFGLGLVNMILSRKYGYEFIKTDPFNLTNPITNFCTELFVPAIFLCLYFSKSSKQNIIVIIISILYSGVLVFTGARTTSMALLACILFYFYDKNKNNKKTKWIFLFGTLVIVACVVWVAQFRHSHEISSFSIFDIFKSLINEMGFNFTSICFTEKFVPFETNYLYGMSYINSFLCLIPKSLDPTGFITNINNGLPEIWLDKQLHVYYSGKYDFGVGYSVIAEAYLNFGPLAFLPVFIQSCIINWLFNKKSGQYSVKINKYIKLILLFTLFTYPRRSFITLLKSIEYDLLLIFVLIRVYNNICKYFHKNSRYDYHEVMINEK